jgi:hypothetical protein
MWLVYSMNKEDIWVSRVPVPIKGSVSGDVQDDFQNQATGRTVAGWNTYSPQWAPVAIAAEGDNRFIRLKDRDPQDYASVTRVFEESGDAKLSFEVRPQPTGGAEPLEIDVVGFNGDRAVALAFDPASSQVMASDGQSRKSVGTYSTGSWVKVDIQVLGAARKYNLSLNGNVVLTNAASPESSPTVERLVFRTGKFRVRDFDRRPYKDGQWLNSRIPGADNPLPTSTYDIDNVKAGSGKAPREWVAVNGPTNDGNSLGGSDSGIGGTFARSSTPRYFVNTNWSRSLRRTETFNFSGEVTLANRDFDGTFFIGYVDKNDLAPPLSVVGITFNEPAGGSGNPFRARGAVRHSQGASSDSPTLTLSQGTKRTFSATWKGNADGSGTLSGQIDGVAFTDSQGRGDDSLNAFGIGVGLDSTSNASRNTGTCTFTNLRFSVP